MDSARLPSPARGFVWPLMCIRLEMGKVLSGDVGGA